MLDVLVVLGIVLLMLCLFGAAGSEGRGSAHQRA